jgi:hypothetical protein
MDFTNFSAWFKSTRSGGGDNCVEIAFAEDGSATCVRDSKDPDGPHLQVDAAQWAGFTSALHAGKFDQ